MQTIIVGMTPLNKPIAASLKPIPGRKYPRHELCLIIEGSEYANPRAAQ